MIRLYKDWNLNIITEKNDKIKIDKRLTDNNEFQVKLTYNPGNNEFIDSGFKELQKRIV